MNPNWKSEIVEHLRFTSSVHSNPDLQKKFSDWAYLLEQPAPHKRKITLDPDKEKEIRTLLKYLNDTPALLSVLYDIDMLPEQLEPNTVEWLRLMILISAWKDREDDMKTPTNLK